MSDRQNSSINFLAEARIPILMKAYSIPCIISLLVAALYNIVDQIFIANASYLGSFGNAANTVVFPLTVVALALAVMVGDGTCTFVSLSIGRGDKESAEKAIGNAITASLVIAAVLTALYFFLRRSFFLPLVVESMRKPSVSLPSTSSGLPQVFLSISSDRQ